MVTFHYQNASLLSLVAFFARILLQHNIVHVDARSWDTVVDVSLYNTAMIDPHREAGTIYNPNATTNDNNEWTISPTTSPTESPTSYPMTNIIDTIPTAIPSAIFTCAVEGNETDTYETRIRMYDSWGDGWGDTKMIISQPAIPYDVHLNLSDTVFNSFADLFTVTDSKDQMEIIYEGTLVDGNEEYRNICLQSNICYTVEVNGTASEWQSEVQWDIRQNDVLNETWATLAKGYAPTKCQFSLPDAKNGTYVCAFICMGDDDGTNTNNATGSIAPSFSSVPSIVPSLTPSLHESNIYSEVPSTVTSVTPSYTPSNVPTSPSSGGSVSIVDTPTTFPVEEKSLRPSLTSILVTPTTLPADEKSLRPSLTSTVMETATTLPTVTFQPTTTMYPTSYMSGGSIIVAVGSGSTSDAEFSDDDAFLTNPVPVTLPTVVNPPVATPTMDRSFSAQGDTATIYPTKTAHPSAYGADFMNSMVHESSVSNAVFSEEVTALGSEDDDKNDGVDDDTTSTDNRASSRAGEFGSASASIMDDDGGPTLTGTGSASIDDDTTPPFFGTSSATIYDDKTSAFTGSASATIDDDTTFASAKLDDDSTFSSSIHVDPHVDAGKWFQTVVLRAPNRSPRRTPTRYGKGLFQSVFTPSFHDTNREPSPTRSPNPTRSQFYEFIFGVRSPNTPTSPLAPSPSSISVSVPSTPVTAPTRPTTTAPTLVAVPIQPPAAPSPSTRPMTTAPTPVAVPIQPSTTSSPSSNTVSVPSNPVNATMRPTTTAPMLVAAPVQLPTTLSPSSNTVSIPSTNPTNSVLTPIAPTVTAPTPTKPSGPSTPPRATFSPTTTFHPTITHYPTITAQPTTTMYPTITAFPTAEKN